jgi:hypothetical protein
LTEVHELRAELQASRAMQATYHGEAGDGLALAALAGVGAVVGALAAFVMFFSLQLHLQVLAGVEWIGAGLVLGLVGGGLAFRWLHLAIRNHDLRKLAAKA